MSNWRERLESMIRSYPQVAQGLRGAFSGIGDGIVEGILGGEIIDGIFGVKSALARSCARLGVTVGVCHRKGR